MAYRSGSNNDPPSGRTKDEAVSRGRAGSLDARECLKVLKGLDALVQKGQESLWENLALTCGVYQFFRVS